MNLWIVVFAAGLMAALIAFPFGFEVRLRERYPDRDKRWEASLVVWGLVAGALLAAGLAAGFDTGTLGGAIGLILVIESALVVGTVVGLASSRRLVPSRRQGKSHRAGKSLPSRRFSCPPAQRGLPRG